MTIAVTDYTLVIRLDRLEECWPEATQRPTNEWCPENFRSDGHLAALEFRAADDARGWADRELVSRGLVHLDGGRCIDLAVVDASQGLLDRCDWLHFEVDAGCGQVTAVGAPKSTPVAPPWWNPTRPPLGRTPASELPRRCRYQLMQAGWGGIFDEVTGEGLALPLAGPFDWIAFFRERLTLLRERTDSQQKLLGGAATSKEQGAALLAISGEAYQIAYTAEPFALDGLRFAGLTARLAGDYRRAPHHWWSVLALTPGDEEARRELAGCYGKGSDLGEDLRRARSAVQSAPGDAEAQRNLAWLLFMLGRLGQAEAWVRRALAIAPKDQVAHVVLGLIAERAAATTR